jgi:hypothetical protein
MAVFKGAEIVSNILLLKGVFDVSIILRVVLIINQDRNSSGRSEEQDMPSEITGLLNTHIATSPTPCGCKKDTN